MTIDPEALSGLSLDEVEGLLRELAKHKKNNLLDFWTPYPKQREFITYGRDHKERLLLAGNQLGKSDCGAYEVACHLTGLYPPGWTGKVYGGPNDWWAAGVSTTVVRDVQQAKLCGPPGVEALLGTGFIPQHCFAGRPTIARGAVSNAFDTVPVHHHNKDGLRDGISYLQFKSYEQGRAKFQGKTLTGGVWWDEEPPQDIYTEGNARWSATDGMSLMTFTPLEGMSEVVLHFLEADDHRIVFLKFRADECPHMTPDKVADIKSRYPRHEWEARLNGEPFMGSGRVFLTPEEFITFPCSQVIPEHWPLLWGIDFGISHPFAAVLGAWDRDQDVIYLVATYRAANELPVIHSEAIRRIAAEAPVAWPHDGAKREAGSGESLAKIYKALDLKMLATHATYPQGGFSTEAAVLEMQQRFADGRLKVREDLADFFAEYRLYHRKDGVLVKLRDDLLSATMKIMMMKRYARVVPLGWTARPNRRSSARPADRGGNLNPWTGRIERTY